MTFTVVLLLLSIAVSQEHARRGLDRKRTQTMPAVEEMPQRPSKRARQHAPPLPGVTGSTGLLLQHKVHSVG